MRSHPQRYVIAFGHEVVGAFVLEHVEHVAFVEKLYVHRG